MTNNTTGSEPSRTSPSDIERVVMRRVYTAHALRPVFSAGALATLIFVVALWGIGREVWVAHVFNNAPHAGLVALGRFYLAAFRHTHPAVQALVLVTAFSAVAATRSITRPLALVLATPRAA